MPGGVQLELQIQPRASRTEFAGVYGEYLKVRLAAPPVDGAANRELVRFLSVALEVPRRDVLLLSGETSRRKVVRLAGVALGDVLARLSRCEGRPS